MPGTLAGAPENVVRAALGMLGQGEARSLDTVRLERVGGGCVNPAARMITDSGRTYFLKWNDAPPAGLFHREASSLRALTDRDGVRAPRVLGVGENWLLLEFIEFGKPTDASWERLALGLARLHEPGPETFGWEEDNFIGPLPQENEPDGNWVHFWRRRRIHPQLRRAVDAGRMAAGEAKLVEAALDRMDELLAPKGPEPSLLHGDLWAGNVIVDRRGDPVLVDPAVYRGDRAVDLAMARLFGGFPDAFFAHYEETFPLPTGPAHLRCSLYQLYPLLVHVNLFGRGYVGDTLRRAREVGEA